MLGQDRLGVELHPEGRILAMAQAHHLALAGEGGHLQFGRQRLFHDQRVVARGLERRGHVGEQVGAVVVGEAWLVLGEM